jgi:putative transposase
VEIGTATALATGAATMGRKTTRRKPLATIWEVPDELWRRIEPILKEFWPRKSTGRPPAHFRRTLNGIIFRMRSGCQWDQLPAKYGPKSTVHGWFQRWAEGGVFEKIWAVLVAECDELGGVEWKWQAADGMLGKARFGGEKDRQEPHRPRETGHQEAHRDRRGGRPAGGGDRRGERAGLQVVGGDDRGDRCRAARP